MAGRRKHTSGYRARSAKQRAQLKKAQLISARKRSRNKKILIGLGSGIVGAGVGIAAVHYSKPHVSRAKMKIAAYPFQKHVKGSEIDNERAQMASIGAFKAKQIRKLKQREELRRRNAARRHTPEQRAEAQKKRKAYLADYNARRRAAYQAERSVANGMRPRKPRAKETKPRKRRDSE